MLAGQQFELDHGDVELALEHLAASDVRKYYIKVHGRLYPVKQAIAAATGLGSDRFITTDAARILRNLGFRVERFGQNYKPAKTESELLFEEYLRSHALGYFEFEPEISGTSARPDYRLLVRGEPILFEVKEFNPDSVLFISGKGGAYDPYGRIREKIEASRKKFKDLEGFSCCLVLYNSSHPLVDLNSSEIIYGAMLGNFGYQFPVDIATGIGDPDKMTPVFHGGGKMLRYKNGEAVAAQNKTISAIVALGHLGLGMRRFSSYVDRVKAESGGALSIEQVWKMTEAAVGTERDLSLRQLRVVVYENPFARLRLPDAIFQGEYDERYGPEDGKLTRRFAGDGILELETEEAGHKSLKKSPVVASSTRGGESYSGEANK